MKSRKVNELKELAERLIEAQKIGSIGNWEWNIKTNQLFWSDQVFKIFGLRKRGFTPTYPKFLERIHPSDKHAVEEAVKISLEKKQPYEVTHRLITPAGEIKFLREKGLTFYNSKGTPVRMAGTVQDITDYKILQNANHLYEFVFEKSLNAILISDQAGKISYANKAAVKMWGYTTLRSMFAEKPNFIDYWADETRNKIQLFANLTVKKGSPETFEPFVAIDRKKRQFYTEHKISPVLSDNGEVLGYLGAFIDITERYQQELKQKEEKRKLDMLLSNIDSVVYSIDARSQNYTIGNFLYLSPNSKDIMGITFQEVMENKNLWAGLIHSDDIENVISSAYRCAIEKKPVTRLYRLKNPRSEHYCWFEDKITPDFDAEGKITSYYGCARNVTERISYEIKLNEAEIKMKALLANIDEVVFGIDVKNSDYLNGEVFYLSARSKELMGFDYAELKSDPFLWYTLIHPDDIAGVAKSTEEFVNKRKSLTRSYRLRHKHSGKYLWFEEKVTPHFNPEGRLLAFYGSARDVTKQVESNELLKKSEQKYRSIYENALVGIFRTNLYTQKALDANDVCIKMFGYDSPEDFLENFTASERWVEPTEKKMLFEGLSVNSCVMHQKMKFRKKDGSTFWGDASAKLLNEEGIIEGVIIDVTENHKYEEELQKNIREKETLLKELHHRVKNNLQIITSLIQVQYNRGDSRSAHENLIETKERIQVIASLHEILYMGHDITSFNFTTFLDKLLNNFRQLYREMEVEIKLDIADYNIDIETAIPLGLLTYEALSNCFKHGFARNRNNLLEISLENKNGCGYVFSISDNGSGFKSDGRTEKNKMGMKIIENLGKQVKANVNIKSTEGKGTCVELTFGDNG